ncbi:MAG: hypothetical protein CMG34_03560 [Candidatus Marinimicrobia bacterium]|nr:hypothetical protein [Candidatus Neomarinimicrobiota bacterium]
MIYDITAYTFNADIWCVGCVEEHFERNHGIAPATAEDMLDDYAEANGIDRMDEASFDSGDFPKVIFEIDLDEVEICGWCHNEIEID